MTTRPLAVLEEVRQSPMAEFFLSGPTFVPRNHSSPSHQKLTNLELDGYLIALVPLPTRASEGAAGYPAPSQLSVLPLTWNELMAQVRRDMGGTTSPKESDLVKFGEIRIDLMAMEVRRSDRLVSLTAMEFKVLRFFVSYPNRVITREELLNKVWGYVHYPFTRTVDNHVLRLRQKLESDITYPVHFRTVHGLGYKFSP